VEEKDFEKTVFSVGERLFKFTNASSPILTGGNNTTGSMARSSSANSKKKGRKGSFSDMNADSGNAMTGEEALEIARRLMLVVEAEKGIVNRARTLEKIVAPLNTYLNGDDLKKMWTWKFEAEEDTAAQEGCKQAMTDVRGNMNL
jgi:hypothetical protein